MRPFNPDPITDRNRELFGEYMRRYEYVPSMNPFDAAISERARELYGEYRSRWSSRKVGYQTAAIDDANGTNWVDCSFLGSLMSPQTFDEAIYQISFSAIGGWAGSLLYRILIDDVKVYPFTGYDVAAGGGTWESLGTLSTAIRTGETCTVQFKSSNAADTGPGQSALSGINLVRYE